MIRSPLWGIGFLLSAHDSEDSLTQLHIFPVKLCFANDHSAITLPVFSWLVSFMPTSSIRFEKWGAKSVEHWGLKMIIGKTTMGAQTAQMMKEKKCVHASPRSVSPNLWIDSIEVQDVHLYDELGRIEAAWFFKLNELGPFIVDIDTKGRNLFDQLDQQIAENKNKALLELGIDPDYQFTKLY